MIGGSEVHCSLASIGCQLVLWIAVAQLPKELDTIGCRPPRLKAGGSSGNPLM